MDAENIISIDGVSKSFGSVQAVRDARIEIRRGEFFSLLGPSGCGKTTLLRMLAGFEAPTEGEIVIDGQPMSAMPAHQRPVNMVFQNYAIFPHLSVAQNIFYGMRKAKLSKGERAALVDEMLEMIKLPGYGARRSHELSGGERQRVALARALIKRPKVLLLDEPLGALDKKLREEMQLELRELQQSVGITFVFVTHDQEEALTMSDRIAVMADGVVLQVDSPARLYEVPASRPVAEFIGTMNFFDGRVEAVEGGTLAVDAGPLGVLRVEPGNEPAVGAGDRVAIGVRPEKISLAQGAPEDDANGVRGTLDAAAYLGDRSHFFVRVDGMEKPVSVAAQNDEHHLGQAAPTSGGEIWLRWAVKGPIVLPAD